MTARVLVLGAGGDMGRSTVIDLAQSDAEVVAADIDSQALTELKVRQAVETTEIDVTAASAKETIRKGNFDVLVNTIGPYYKFGPHVQRLAIEAGVHYVDICDDADATKEQLAMHEEAADAGVTCVVGAGASPGAANLLAMYAASQLDDDVSIEIEWAVPADDTEGRGALQHALYGITVDAPQLKDGQLVDAPSGGNRRVVEYPKLGRVPTYVTDHPEPMTLKDHIDASDIKVRGGLLPAYQMRALVVLARLGVTATEKRRQVLATMIEKLHQVEDRFDSAERRPSALRVEVSSDSETIVYSGSTYMGTGTGRPASVAAQQLATNEFEAGVYPPEAVFDPEEFLSTVGERGVEFFELEDTGWTPISEFS